MDDSVVAVVEVVLLLVHSKRRLLGSGSRRERPCSPQKRTTGEAIVLVRWIVVTATTPENIPAI